MSNSVTVVGKSIPRVDAEQKVTGAAKYTCDLALPGMLCGKVLRSPYSHAKILSIDTSKAERVKGVEAVICGRNNPSKLYGVYIRDQSILANDKVRFVGDPVVAIAAVAEDAAEEALSLVEVQYEELQPIFDPEESIEERANLIHEGLDKYVRPDECRAVGGTNICNYVKVRKGDVQKGFKEAFKVYEDRFTTQLMHHCYLEPHAVIADIDSSGSLTLYGSFQAPFMTRAGIANLFQIPVSRVRVITPFVGGGFGGKCTMTLEPIAVSLAMKTGKPIKLIMSRNEDFIASVVRHPAIVYIKTGVNKNGEILAREIKLIWDTGGYADYGPVVAIEAVTAATGPYRVPNVSIDSYCVYTNKPIGGAFRSFGSAQVHWASESQVDIIARDLGIDPVDIRLINAVEEGSSSAVGETLHSVGFNETLREASNAIGWGKRKPSGRGVGVASMIHFTVAFLPSSAIVKVCDDGSVRIYKGAVELGQGTNTILTQIVSEVMGIPVDKISIAPNDTEFVPYDWGTFSSRQTFCSGNAVRFAAEDAKRQLLAVASEKFGVKPDDLICADGKLSVKGEPDRVASFDEIASYSYLNSGPIIGKGSFHLDIVPLDPETGQSPRFIAYYMYATQIAEVEVDEQTGVVKILKLVAAHDVGRAINPLNIKQQIEGGLVMGIGTTLYEELVLDAGNILNATFVDYKVPRAKDIPELVPIIVEAPHREGPFGAKGVGETTLIPTTAAISNAIYDAIGVRIKDLPITPEKIVKARREKHRLDNK